MYKKNYYYKKYVINNKDRTKGSSLFDVALNTSITIFIVFFIYVRGDK